MVAVWTDPRNGELPAQQIIDTNVHQASYSERKCGSDDATVGGVRQRRVLEPQRLRQGEPPTETKSKVSKSDSDVVLFLSRKVAAQRGLLRVH